MPQVLIVEDDILNARLLGYIVESEGYGVNHAENGLVALEAVRKSSPDLIFLDLQMPGMNGFELLERLKADPATSGIPVVAVTASVMGADDRELCLDRGFSDYLLKPVYIDELKEVMGRYLGNKETNPNL